MKRDGCPSENKSCPTLANYWRTPRNPYRAPLHKPAYNKGPLYNNPTSPIIYRQLTKHTTDMRNSNLNSKILSPAKSARPGCQGVICVCQYILLLRWDSNTETGRDVANNVNMPKRFKTTINLVR